MLIQVVMHVAQLSIMMQIAVCVARYHELSCNRLHYQITVSHLGQRTEQQGSCYCNSVSHECVIFLDFWSY
jgi:hypothetical protein